MVDRNGHKQPKPRILASPKNTAVREVMGPDTIPSEHIIRERAHELYERRGGEPGRDQQDWLQAEQEILGARERKP